MKKSDILNKFNEISLNPYQWISNYAESAGQKAIAYFCSYAPEELLHAAGFLPVRIWGNQQQSPKVNAHLQSYCCFTIKSILGLLLDNKLDFLYGALFSHSCDSMQCLSDIWELNSNLTFHETFNMPTKLNGHVAVEYTVQELHRIKNSLQTTTQRPSSDEKLSASIKIYNKTRQLMRELYQLRKASPNLLTGSEMHTIQTAFATMPVEQSYNLLKLLIDLLIHESTKSVNAPKLLISGAVLDDPNIIHIVEELGAAIVDDDLCSGSRSIERDINMTDDAVTALAKSLINRIACPCKYNPAVDRAKYLIKRVKDSDADGVVFYLQKYCDPHFSDYPYLKSKLDAQNIHSLLIEAEKPGQNLGQIKNRLQAFLEILEKN